MVGQGSLSTITSTPTSSHLSRPAGVPGVGHLARVKSVFRRSLGTDDQGSSLVSYLFFVFGLVAQHDGVSCSPPTCHITKCSIVAISGQDGVSAICCGDGRGKYIAAGCFVKISIRISPEPAVQYLSLLSDRDIRYHDACPFLQPHVRCFLSQG